MPLSPLQIRRLKAPLKRQYVKERQLDGANLHYLEGWHVVSEANRIFGFGEWDRVTVSSECVWRHPVEGGFAAAYLVRIRVKVRAGEQDVVREGLGSGEAIAPTPGQAHERAAKAAETDATKRALSTFGNPFGLSLYKGHLDRRGEKIETERERSLDAPAPRVELIEPAQPPVAAKTAAAFVPRRIEKSALTFGEPKRQRNPEHLRFVAGNACLVCGRMPSQAHHLRFMQPRALARKVSDEFTVPLCALHHQELHLAGNEKGWWVAKKIDPTPTAEALWRESASGVEAHLEQGDQVLNGHA